MFQKKKIFIVVVVVDIVTIIIPSSWLLTKWKSEFISVFFLWISSKNLYFTQLLMMIIIMIIHLQNQNPKRKKNFHVKHLHLFFRVGKLIKKNNPKKVNEWHTHTQTIWILKFPIFFFQRTDLFFQFRSIIIMFFL